MNYGYKVYYKKQDKLKVYVVTNSYDFALWHKDRYQKQHPNISLLVMPITTYKEYMQRWRGCPF